MKATILILSSLAITAPAFADDEAPDPALDTWSETSEEPAPEPPAVEVAPEAPAPTAVAPVVALPAAPSALTKTAAPYTRAISLQLATLDTGGMAIALERVSKTRPKTSVALILGGRSAARGEYASKTAGIGLEVKRWLRRPLPMTGWYVAARTDLARTSVVDAMEDREIGKLTTWSAGVSTGYRWVVFHKVELTPSIGASVVVEGGDMSPTTSRGAGVVGLTAGWIF